MVKFITSPLFLLSFSVLLVGVPMIFPSKAIGWSLFVIGILGMFWAWYKYNYKKNNSSYKISKTSIILIIIAILLLGFDIYYVVHNTTNTSATEIQSNFVMSKPTPEEIYDTIKNSKIMSVQQSIRDSYINTPVDWTLKTYNGNFESNLWYIQTFTIDRQHLITFEIDSSISPRLRSAVVNQQIVVHGTIKSIDSIAITININSIDYLP